ncbi:hypothetical protein HanIR_Chr04g0173591 [Helianthus annuus]|nr:hypothetical protein HanIR_Chr04g0173591 [Helianthus annuus]
MLCRTIGTQLELAWRRVVVGHGLLRVIMIGGWILVSHASKR